MPITTFKEWKRAREIAVNEGWLRSHKEIGEEMYKLFEYHGHYFCCDDKVVHWKRVKEWLVSRTKPEESVN